VLDRGTVARLDCGERARCGGIGTGDPALGTGPTLRASIATRTLSRAVMATRISADLPRRSRDWLARRHPLRRRWRCADHRMRLALELYRRPRGHVAGFRDTTRQPDLRVAMIEGGFAWLPALRWRLEKTGVGCAAKCRR
jgi:hypothetical protein